MKIPWRIAGDGMDRKCKEEVTPMRITRISVDGLVSVFAVIIVGAYLAEVAIFIYFVGSFLNGFVDTSTYLQI